VAETYDLVVRGGEVVNHAGRGLADVGVRAGRIAAIGDLGQASSGEVFDAAGLTVLPGVIDTHVHFREPVSMSSFHSRPGSRAAVLGGVTAVFEMPNTEPTTTGAEAFADKLARAAGRAHCDHAFFVGATGQNARSLGDLERLPGCSGVKVFMGSSTGSLLVADDLDLREVLQHGRRRVAVHAEDECCLVQGRSLVRIGDWTSHPFARAAACAIRGTERLLALAAETGRRVHVLHVTTAEEMELLGRRKDLVTCEVTPQHLTLSAPGAYEQLHGRAQMNPPIRDSRHQAGLWRGLAEGVVDTLGSDHAPHTLEEKAKAYPGSPSGMPGVQTLVSVMLTHVAEGRLTLERFVDLTSAGPQRVFNIAGKGRLAVGWDADLTLVDLKARRTIRNADQATRVGWTPFDGLAATGWPMATIIRGRIVMRDGELTASGKGEPIRFLETLEGRP
jgi:dihydroorotase